MDTIYVGGKMDYKINRSTKESLYLIIYEKIKKNILDGILKKDSRLPAIRKAAKLFEVNTTTIVKAYDLLERDGFLYKIVGSGSYVAEVRTPVEASSEEIEALEEVWDINLLEENKINLASATPSPRLFPVEAFKDAINKVLDRDGGSAFIYEDSKGYKPLREEVAKLLKLDRIKVSGDNIQIVSGSQQAIDIVSKMFIQPGDRVIVEEPTYPGAISSFKRAGAHILTVPMESDGINLKRLQHLVEKEERIAFIYIISNFQNPTGVSMSSEKMKKLLKIVKGRGINIVEDDCMSEIYYTKEKPRSLKYYDKDDMVIYIKSFSKIFMPGLRFAFMLLSDKLKDKALRLKYMADISTSVLTQRAFYEYLTTKKDIEHLREIRSTFKRRYAIMKELLDEVPQLELPYKIDGGLLLWVKLPDWMDGEKFSKIAYEEGVIVFPGARFCYRKGFNSFIRLSFAGVEEDDIRKGIEGIKQALKRY